MLYCNNTNITHAENQRPRRREDSAADRAGDNIYKNNKGFIAKLCYNVHADTKAIKHKENEKMEDNNELQGLIDLVKELLDKSDKDAQIKILQEINEKLLCEYCIEINGLVILPLRVEAYYFDPDKFKDSTVHGNDQQRLFNKLYVHSDKKGNGGVDVCLAYNSKKRGKPAPYFLSFLIKNSYVNGENCKQIDLNDKLTENATVEEIHKLPALRKRNDGEKPESMKKGGIIRDTTVFHTARVGLSGKPFGREPLAALIDIDRKGKDDKLFYDFAAGCGKEQILAEYLWQHQELLNDGENKAKWNYGNSQGVPAWKRRIDDLTVALKQK